VAVVNLSASLNLKNRVPDGNSLGSIRLWVAKRRHDGLTDGLGTISPLDAAALTDATERPTEARHDFAPLESVALLRFYHVAC
jgi:hypothetical protein